LTPVVSRAHDCSIISRREMAMATKRAGKSRTSKTKRAAAKPRAAAGSSGVSRLRGLIGTLIESRRRGAADDVQKAARALEAFAKQPPSAELRQAAAEARAVADNDVLSDSMRMLGQIDLRLSMLEPGKPASKPT
jgi:hypothetical protein